MNAVYASNDHYVRHLGTSIYSLFDSNLDMEEITVYILSVGLSDDSKEKLVTIADRFERQVVIIELGDLKERFSYEVHTGGFDISTLSRLFIGEVLPQSVERVLYLDCDTVIVKSLEKLWGTRMGGNVAGAVMEPTIYPQIKEEIGLAKMDPYFNAGVLLIDLKRWRAEGVQGKLLTFYGSRGGRLFACDQDTINGVLKGRIKPLSPRFNFFTNYRYFPYKELVRLSPSYGAVPEKLYGQAIRYPVLIHYMGDERPWIAGNLNHYRNTYERYLALTPWKGTPKEKGKEIYMLAYHAMDYITFVCPAIRRFISRKFGMKTVELRTGSAEKRETKEAKNA